MVKFIGGWEILFDDPGARVPPSPIVPSGTMLNPNGMMVFLSHLLRFEKAEHWMDVH